MAFASVLDRADEYLHDFETGERSVEAFREGICGCIAALDGLDYHQHIKRVDVLTYQIQHETLLKEGRGPQTEFCDPVEVYDEAKLAGAILSLKETLAAIRCHLENS